MHPLRAGARRQLVILDLRPDPAHRPGRRRCHRTCTGYVPFLTSRSHAMLRRTSLALLPAFLVAPALTALAGPATAATSTVRIMPLGDSITAGPGCWRAMLWNKLQTA